MVKHFLLLKSSIKWFKNLDIEFKLLALFFLIAHGGSILILDAIFWDDWILYRSSSTDLFDIFKQTGSPFNFAGYLHFILLEAGPWIYKILTFILMFFSGILLNKILIRYENIDKNTRFFIVLLFLILPLNSARVALINFPAILCYFLFFLAWFLMDRYRIAALILFFISFSVNSLLVFYAIPFIDMIYRKLKINSSKDVLIYSINKLDYLLLPFAFFFIKNQYFEPYQEHAGYNKNFNLAKLPELALKQLDDFLNLNIPIILSLVLAVFSYYVFKKYKFILINLQSYPIPFFIIGFLFFFLGVFPYMIVGHTPTFLEWTSRHQLLMPLGVSLITFAICSSFKNEFILPQFNLVAISLVVGISLSINIYRYKEFFVDWQKQQQLVSLFSVNSKIKNGSLIVIDDQTIHMNAIGRGYRYYEWSGMLELAFGDQKRFGIYQFQLPLYLEGKFLPSSFTSAYKAGHFDPKKEVSIVFIEVGLIEPIGPREKLINKLFPRFALKITNHD
jgi:hypothetical protein